MSLDIATPKGRQAAADQIHCVRSVLKTMGSQSSYVHTDDSGAAVVDGFIVRADGSIAAAVEVKTRYDMDDDQFWRDRNGTWLVTFQKLMDIRLVSSLLKVPAYGFLYLRRSGVVYVVKLFNADGSEACEYMVQQTRTQRTINGGEAERANAFIDMRHARKVVIGD